MCYYWKLGAGESGKSTIAKQMKIIYLEGYSDEERLHYKDIIYSNMIYSMRSLILGAQDRGIEIQDGANKQIAESLIGSLSSNELTQELAADLKHLWNDDGIQEALKRQSEFQLFDSTE